MRTTCRAAGTTAQRWLIMPDFPDGRPACLVQSINTASFTKSALLSPGDVGPVDCRWRYRVGGQQSCSWECTLAPHGAACWAPRRRTSSECSADGLRHLLDVKRRPREVETQLCKALYAWQDARRTPVLIRHQVGLQLPSLDAPCRRLIGPAVEGAASLCRQGIDDFIQVL